MGCGNKYCCPGLGRKINLPPLQRPLEKQKPLQLCVFSLECSHGWLCRHSHSTLHSFLSRAHPELGEKPVSMPVSPSPHLTVSHASFILSTSMGTGTYNGLYCWKKPPSKTGGTFLSLPKGRYGFSLAKKHVKSHREGGKRQNH